MLFPWNLTVPRAWLVMLASGRARSSSPTPTLNVTDAKIPPPLGIVSSVGVRGNKLGARHAFPTAPSGSHPVLGAVRLVFGVGPRHRDAPQCGATLAGSALGV